MIFLGIVLGLAAAVSQSLSYLLSRWFMHGRGRSGAVRLLVLGHVIPGLISLPIAVLSRPDDLPPIRQWLPELVGVTGFLLAGQVGLFWALRYTDASRVSPILGLKIAILAGITVLALGDPFTLTQAVAVAAAVAAAFILNYSGGTIPWPATVALLFTCTGYALSDLCIRLLLEDMRPVGRFHASLFGVAVSYVLCAAVLAPLLPWCGSRDWRDWRDALPYAAVWLLAMVFLYACFAAVGVVLGNILQATRGGVSIVLGAVVSKLGHEHVEARVPRQVFYRRLAAAAMMLAAIALFVLGRPG